MSTPENILGKIGQKVGEEIKSLRVSIGNSIGNINLNDITGGLNVTKNTNTGIGISTDGKGVFNTLEVSLASTLKGAVTANSTITALGAISGLRAETTADLAVGTNATIGNNLDVLGKITAGSLEVQGETKIINTTSVEVSDNILELNKSTDSATTGTISGIEINRGITEATTGGQAVGSIAINGSFPNEEETYEYNEIFLQQVELIVNDNYVYESLEKTGNGTFSAGLYRISFFHNLETPSTSTYSNGMTGGDYYDGWVLQRKDANGDYQHISQASIPAPIVSHAITITNVSHPSASSSGSAVNTHGLFIVRDDANTLNFQDTSNPYLHHSSYPLADGDALNISNSTSVPFYVHKRTGTSTYTVVATVSPNATSMVVLSEDDALLFSTNSDIASAGNIASGIMQITVGSQGTTTQDDPAFIRATDAMGVDTRTKFEEWSEADLPASSLLSSGNGDVVIYQTTYGSLVSQATALETQEVPYAQATSSSVNEKAKFLWDNAGDQQKFKFLVGDGLADLSSNSLTVPNGSGVVIGTAPIGTYADFTNALAEAKE
jgi:hypothetical protein